MIERAPSVQHLLTNEVAALLHKDEVAQILYKIHEEYLYWDKVKYMHLPGELLPQQLWALVKLQRKTTQQTIHFGSYRFQWNIGNDMQELLHFFDTHITGSRELTKHITGDEKNGYLINSIMEEAIASSQIEGAATSRKQAKEMLRKQLKPRDKGEQMILNNYHTIQHILELKNEPLNMATLLQLHQLVTHHTMYHAAEEGALRTDNEVNVVDTATGQIVHHPPDYNYLPALLGDFFHFFNDKHPANTFVHPVIKACIVHFMLGFIHPFADGNGRTARALFYWYMIKHNYSLVEYLSISRLILKSRGQYAKAFQYTEVDEHDMTYFIRYNMKTLKMAFDELVQYLQKKTDEKEKRYQLTAIEGISYRQSGILEWFIKEPSLMLTVHEVQTRLGISYGTARNDLNELLALNYLQIRHINKVTKGYIRGGAFGKLLTPKDKPDR